MKLRQGDIVKLKEPYTAGYDYAMVTFPVSEGDDFCIIDAVPCTKQGECAEGFEVGVPMETDNFQEIVGNYDEH